MTRTVGITGASGYLGTALTRGFALAGWRTVGLVRSPSSPDDRLFRLGAAIDPPTLDGLDLLIHAAYDLKLVDRTAIWSTNVAGTELLLKATRAAGVPRVIVVSSMSAYAGTRQLYGQAKLHIERVATEYGGIIVRPGLVLGESLGGMAGSLAKLCALPLTPTVAGAGLQFPVAEEDFTAAMIRLADLPAVPLEPLGLAQETPVTFNALLRAIAPLSGRTPHRLLPVPWPVIYGALWLGERLGLRLPFRADSLMGLVRPATSLPGTATLKAIGIQPRLLIT